MDTTLLLKRHLETFGKRPALVAFAPGRVNFIGEHTDYNGGLVMPLALPLGIAAAVSPNGLDTLRICSMDFNATAGFPLSGLAPDPSQAWANCPKGMVEMIRRKGADVPGLDLTLTGNLPVGAGLSSSAAVEVVTGTALNALLNLKLEPMDLALLAQQAEHVFTGTKCGIMDQAISVLGRANHLLKLSCRDLSFEYAPFELGSHKLLVVNTGVKHNLADGEYNKRRQECAEAFETALVLQPGLRDLSDLPLPLLESARGRFSEVVYRRARHVLTENRRVQNAAALLSQGHLTGVGRLMSESHDSLRRDYEVTCEELDFLVEGALPVPGVLGARMTGGGFGGCVIVLLDKTAEPAYCQTLVAYEKRFGKAPQVIEAVPSQGAHLL